MASTAQGAFHPLDIVPRKDANALDVAVEVLNGRTEHILKTVGQLVAALLVSNVAIHIPRRRTAEASLHLLPPQRPQTSKTLVLGEIQLPEGNNSALLVVKTKVEADAVDMSKEAPELPTSKRVRGVPPLRNLSNPQMEILRLP